jgi:pyruvate dehydrogenase kinase 2/3/4
VAQDAINDARSICMREYGAAPDVSIYGDPSFVFAYVPSHLHHMVFELVKNSLRAVQDRFEDADDEPPPIRCDFNLDCIDQLCLWCATYCTAVCCTA